MPAWTRLSPRSSTSSTLGNHPSRPISPPWRATEIRSVARLPSPSPMSEPRVWTVDPGNPLPLYYQGYASLLERIQGGEFSPGSFLPAERQLTEDYGVSRITVIKALNALSREHHIKRHQGRGTVVTNPADRPNRPPRSVAVICHRLDHRYLCTRHPSI